MMYDERFIAPMRAELTQIGFQELRTPDEVDATLPNAKGTMLVVVNSMCGCAARNARPGVAMALQQAPARPDALTTVFAGQDADATERARSYFTGYPPSSPSIALLRDGQLVYMMERYEIEGRPAQAIAADLSGAFERHCGAAAA
jgi:putative YphP/YqiW family bacilliredoxin